MTETLIWANMNDSHNMDVIIKENTDLKNFVPKATPQKIDQKNTTDSFETIVANALNIIETYDYKNDNFLNILIKQNIIMNYLDIKFKSTEPDSIIWDEFKYGLEWILKTSQHIVSIKKIDTKQFPADIVHRSSYKFCTSKENCDLLYNNALQNTTSKKSRCNGDHYVHHKIVQDITCLIAVLDKNNETLYNDLRVGLLTLIFVINKMYQELSVFSLYLSNTPGFNINNYYSTKNIRNR